MKKNKCYIIAEIGINHDGKLENVIKLIKYAKKAGASAVKFQVYDPHTLGRREDERLIKLFKSYPSETRYKMWKRLSFKKNWIDKISKECKKQKIDLGFSVFDEESLNKIKRAKPKFIKIASSDLNDLFLIKQIKKTKIKIIVSSGMSYEKEIRKTIKILKNYNFTILHCVSLYPTDYKLVNLKRMQKIKKLHHSVGFSDHSIGISAAIKAIEMGASVLEKHFTYDKFADGPDHKCSADFHDMKLICDYALMNDKILGNGNIKPSKKELLNRINAKKSIWAKKDINKGENFSVNNIEKTRPYSGLSADRFPEIIKKKSKYNFKKGDLIKI